MAKIIDISLSFPRRGVDHRKEIVPTDSFFFAVTELPLRVGLAVERLRWVEERFGQDECFYRNHDFVCFRRYEDAVEFLLMWG